MTKEILITVGTGDKKNLEKTLFAPMRESINRSYADVIIFLPSEFTLGYAKKLSDEFKDKQVIIKTLENSKVDDADQCFDFYDKLLQERLKEKKVSPENIIIDFTRGTRAMSAALYFAGLKNNISDFRYVTAKKGINRGDSGQVVAGSEEIKMIDASYAKSLSILDQCKYLFQANQFSAVKTLLDISKISKKLKDRLFIDDVYNLANFYLAWDRFDYREASSICPRYEVRILNEFSIPQYIQVWIDKLQEGVLETPNDRFFNHEECLNNANQAILLIFDLYGNALRRLKAGQLEDAAIRAYRMLEMIGQIALFKRGFDSSRMPVNNDIQEFCNQKRIPIKGNGEFCIFSRTNTKDFLNLINDPISNFLEIYDRQIANIRNNGILIHGYKSRVDDENNLRLILDAFLKKLEDFISENDWEEYKKCAEFMNRFAEIN